MLVTGDQSPKLIRVLAIVGTRPEAIKVAPIAIAAAGRSRIVFRMLATGQHDTLFDDALAAFGLTPDARLDPVANDPSPDVMTGRLVTRLRPVLATDRPDLVLVQGDTTSAYAAALAADQLGIPVGHVEAGLRSHDLASPWPEERNRVAIDRLAALLFAPTRNAEKNLERDTGVTGRVLVTGNTGIDALLAVRRQLAGPPPHRRGDLAPILLTCHRRESFGAGIEGICAATLRLAEREDVRILCPVHPNPAVDAPLRARLAGHPRILLSHALGYREMIARMAAARLILTDSGGIQEEAPALGIPTLVLRDVTERPEGLTSGNLVLVGTHPDWIVAVADLLLDDRRLHARMARPTMPFGDGDASAKILDGVERYFSRDAIQDRSLPLVPVWTKDGAPKGA